MGQVVVELTGDEAKLLRSIQNVINANLKAKQSFKQVGDESKSTGQKVIDSLNGSVVAVESIARSFVTIDSAIAAAIKTSNDYRESLEKSLSVSRELATSQSRLTANVAGTSKADIKKIVDVEVPQIVQRANYSDASIINETIGETTGIVGKEDAIKVTEQAAKLTRHDKQATKGTATAIADFVKNVDVTPEQAVSLIGSSASVNRVADTEKLAKSQVTVANAAILQNPKHDKVESARAGMALHSVFSPLDPNGEQSATMSVNQLDLVGRIFNPNDAEKQNRELRLKELEKRDRIDEGEQADINRAKFELSRRERDAKFFKPEDQSSRAINARLNVDQQRAKLKELETEARLTGKDLVEFEALKEINSVKDPGNLVQQYEVIQANPKLRNFALQETRGDAKFQATAREMFTAGSKVFEMFKENFQKINDSPENARAFIDSKSVTFDQRVNDAREQESTNNTLRQLSKIGNDKTVIAAADEMTTSALQRNRKGWLAETYANWSEYGLNSIGVGTKIADVSSTPEQAINSAIMTLESRLVDLTSWENGTDQSKWSEKGRATAEDLNRTKDALRDLLKAYQEQVQESKNASKELLSEVQKQTSKVEEQNNILRENHRADQNATRQAANGGAQMINAQLNARRGQ